MNRKNPNTAQHNKKKNKAKKRKFAINRHWYIVGSGFLVFVLIVFAITQVFFAYRKNYFKMEKLSRELVNLRSAMNIDSVRQYKIQKILKIIESHNSNLSSAEAYDIANEIYEMSVKYANLDIDLLCAVITHESGVTWDPKVVSKAGAMGLMQIMPVTGLFLAGYEGLTWTNPEEAILNPVYNIRMGARFLSMLIDQYGLDGGLAAYNGGEKQASLWLKNGKDDKYLWSETRQYIPAVRKLYDAYQSQGL